MTIGEVVRGARATLAAAGIPGAEAALDAAGLAMLALDCDRAALLTCDGEPSPAGLTERLAALQQRRAAREPMAYIRGHQEFWGRDFIVSPAVLIPRPETELIIEEALAWRRTRIAHGDLGPPVVVDIGTGSGCLAVTLACEWPDTRIDAVDISTDALAVAHDNARRHAVADRIRYRAGSYLAGIDAPIHLIVTNPPYVPDHDRAGLQVEVRDHEPAQALFGGCDGLRDVRATLREAVGRLEGRLLMEIGAGQAAAVHTAVRGTPGLSLLDIRADLHGIPRVAIIASGSG